MEIVYRTLETKDLDAYRKVRLECLKAHPENFGSTFEEESEGDTLLLGKILSKSQTSEFMMGAFHDGELIGICGMKQEGRLKTNHRGEIVQMYVRSSFAGKGIGKKILESALGKAFANPSIDQVTLGVVADNQGAVTLYKNLGFIEYGKLGNSFKAHGQGTTQLLMVLTRERYLGKI